MTVARMLRSSPGLPRVQDRAARMEDRRCRRPARLHRTTAPANRSRRRIHPHTRRRNPRTRRIPEPPAIPATPPSPRPLALPRLTGTGTDTVTTTAPQNRTRATRRATPRRPRTGSRRRTLATLGSRPTRANTEVVGIRRTAGLPRLGGLEDHRRVLLRALVSLRPTCRALGDRMEGIRVTDRSDGEMEVIGTKQYKLSAEGEAGRVAFRSCLSVCSRAVAFVPESFMLYCLAGVY